MPAFETANIMLALAGNRNETVPKYDVTVAEIAVLRFLHGEDAVFDIDPQGSVERTDRQEIERLRATYQRRDGERVISDAVAALFPGVGAKAMTKLEDLDLPDELFAVKERKGAKVDDDDADDDEKPLDKMTAKELRARASKYPELDIGGLTKKEDLLEAIQLHEKQIADAANSGSVFE